MGFVCVTLGADFVFGLILNTARGVSENGLPGTQGGGGSEGASASLPADLAYAIPIFSQQ